MEEIGDASIIFRFWILFADVVFDVANFGGWWITVQSVCLYAVIEISRA